ncbi:hypothetical protein DTL42_04290 [Bremerella cremea]|uniref:Uncharacterized protein n=1 Tax=Bremerella cremea TaxID=1031537 RepID=A0A368KYK2_9BACT|nr:hypothetical protein DTL42_04290 [Bremerella cremea]
MLISQSTAFLQKVLIPRSGQLAGFPEASAATSRYLRHFLGVANPDGGDACIFLLIIAWPENLGKVIHCFKLGRNDYID